MSDYLNALQLPNRILLGPGPSNVHPRVLQAMLAPMLGHLDPDFWPVLDHVRDMLRRVLGTTHPWTLPLSATGKVDRRALPEPQGGRQAVATPYVEPGTARERAIAGAVCEALGIDRAGRDDNLFDLGAHSLLLVKLASRLSERLGEEVRVVDLFRFPTVAGLAAHLGGEAGEEIDRAVHDRRAAERRRSLADRRRRHQGAAGEKPEDEEDGW